MAAKMAVPLSDGCLQEVMTLTVWSKIRFVKCFILGLCILIMCSMLNKDFLQNNINCVVVSV